MLSIITGLNRSGKLRVYALAASLAMLAAACDKMPLLAPRESTIKLSTASTVVQANGTTELRATVLESSGTPVHNGTTVTFTTNLGAVSPVDARTNNGMAVVQFLGNGQSGKATIRAVSGGATSDPLELTVGAAAVGRVVVTANPNQVASGNPSIITATVTDTGGNPLNGLVVSFSTDNGSLSTTSATTSFSGQAQTTLATTRDATVTASTGTGTGTSGTVKIVVVSLPDITITPSPSAPTEGQPVSFTIALSSALTTETFQSLFVDFGDGTSVGPLSGTSQNVSHVYSSSGTYNVIATGTSGSGNTKRGTTVITVTERGVVNVTIAKIPATAVNKNEIVTFTATATTGGTVSNYSWNFGDGQTFTGSNQVSHSYSTSGTKTVTATVTTTDGNSGRGQTQVMVNP